jgi:hypothetical protein
VSHIIIIAVLFCTAVSCLLYPKRRTQFEDVWEMCFGREEVRGTWRQIHNKELDVWPCWALQVTCVWLRLVHNTQLHAGCCLVTLMFHTKLPCWWASLTQFSFCLLSSFDDWNFMHIFSVAHVCVYVCVCVCVCVCCLSCPTLIL